MNTKRCVVIALLTCCLTARGATQADLYGDNNEPTPPEPFPALYQDYQILPGTISPDQRYALIYPKRSRVYELRYCGLFLVALKPFHVLAQLPRGNSNLCENARCGFASNWAKNSSAVVMIADNRWGAEKVSVTALRAGQIVKRAELTAQVRWLVRPSFRNSHAARCNDYYDFVFSERYFGKGDYIEVPADHRQQGWDLDDAGHVIVDCVCTTDPKGFDPHHWTVHFTGLWDVDKEAFLRKKVEVISFDQPF